MITNITAKKTTLVENYSGINKLGVSNCDTNINLLNLTLDDLFTKDFNHLIILGDIVAHKVTKDQRKIALDKFAELLNKKLKNANKKITVDIAIGNNDFTTTYSLPKDDQSFNDEVKRIKQVQNTENKNALFYSNEIGGVEFIFIFTPFYTEDTVTPDDDKNLLEQNKFLEDKLNEAKTKGKKVVICFHVSPFSTFDRVRKYHTSI